MASQIFDALCVVAGLVVAIFALVGVATAIREAYFPKKPQD